ncbi:MAG: hypothetical protein KDB00_15405, partial [Planctomycetales bacterium]|nr:hypothetical protein [Planctomycetales bacterium]
MAFPKSRRRWLLIAPAFLVASIAIGAALRTQPDVQQDVAPTVTDRAADQTAASAGEVPSTR